uniref:Uncharacterized protein n=1 Tax=Glossina brevipalpis TaxID=37001 RepID=A0A1A9WNG8_9MUSC
MENEEEKESVTFRRSRSIVRPSRHSRVSFKSQLHETYEPKNAYESEDTLLTEKLKVTSEEHEKKEFVDQASGSESLETIKKDISNTPAHTSRESQTDAVPQTSRSLTNVSFLLYKDLKKFSFKKLLPSYWLYNKGAHPIEPLSMEKSLSTPLEQSPVKKFAFRNVFRRKK